MSDSNRAAKAAAVLWSAAILIAVALPGSTIPESALEFDKAVHFVLFSGFSWLWLRAFPRAAVAVVGGGILYGIVTEVGQTLAAGARTGDPLDAVANVLGVLAGTGAAWLLDRRRRRPPHTPSESRGA